MAFSNLSSVQVRQLIGLIKRKESLQSKLDKVNETLEGIESNGTAAKPGRKRRGRKPKATSAAAAKPGRKAGQVSKATKPRKRGKRLKGPLLKALKSAGPSGIAVKELAAKLKVKPGNIFSWFYTTGKKVKGISKVGEAKYAYAG